MAEWSAMTSCTNLQLQMDSLKTGVCIPRRVYFTIMEGGCLPREYRILFPLQSLAVRSANTRPVTTVEGERRLPRRGLRCQCIGNAINPVSMSVFEWVPFVDQMLLVTSAAFAYMAGVLPLEKTSVALKRNSMDVNADAMSSTTTGSAMEGLTQSNFMEAWDEVQKKLVDSIDAGPNDGNLEMEAAQNGNNNRKRPLSLHAIDDGARLRLLWATFLHLQKEVQSISGNSGTVNREEWLVVISRMMRASVQPICTTWLTKESSVRKKMHNPDALERIFQGQEDDGSILSSIRKTGKEELYADMLFLLRFGSVRAGGYYDGKFLAQHSINILEDLVVVLADRIANIYLELISVDSSLSNEMNGMDLLLCSLSTRELQKLRNEVALNSWIYQNIEVVISMYEDRFDLFVLKKESIGKASEISSNKYAWWKRLSLKKSESLSASNIMINNLSLPVKRIKELRALTGWMYYFSLYLEFSDIAMPFVKVVLDKVSSAISFFFVCLIGRSLGLIYTGIRQSLSWK
ncbi:uncharacterized protein LOC116265131 [Nymphaea colorata]|nr:uncharacterized protein LOC116265131 [Nymphaea colorata]XP_031501506.1 uncharacterized protein LOC116265131 [Nymphaea colorata]XP_031501507.1 uncharacterized protein LOC116265131 [Nymphaea colorata]